MFDSIKKYFTALFKKFFLKELKMYESIDELPIWNWFKIHETNDLSYLLKTTHKVGWQREEEMILNWSKIHDEFLTVFGINDKLRKIYEIKRNIGVLRADMFLQKDASKETLIEIEERELAELQKETSKTDVHLVKGYVEKYMSRYIDEKVTTVRSYYSYLKIMEQDKSWQGIK